jgi:hypothetical protein
MYSLNLTCNFTPLYSERLYDIDFLKTTARVSAKNEKMVKIEPEMPGLGHIRKIGVLILRNIIERFALPLTHN